MIWKQRIKSSQPLSSPVIPNPSARPLQSSFTRLIACFIALSLGLAACSDEPTPAPPIAATIFVTLPASNTPASTPAPATDTPAPTPTPDANTLQLQAETAIHHGDTPQAIQRYAEELALLPAGSAEAIRTQLSLAQQQFRAGDTAAAAQSVAPLVNNTVYTDVNFLADAQTLLIRTQLATGNLTDAVVQYQQAISASNILSPYLSLWLGDAYINASQPISAITPYEQSLIGSPSLSIEFSRREKLALAYRLANQPADAIAQHQSIVSRSQVPAYQARINWELAQDYLNAGQTEQAYVLMRDLVTNFSNTNAAGQALQALLAANQAVDPLLAGIVQFNTGSYDAARESFRAAIALEDGRGDVIRYWAALNYLELDLPDDAVRNLDQTIAGNTDPGRVAEAWAEKAKLYADLENEQLAKDSYIGFKQVATATATNASDMFAIGAAFERRQWFPEAIEAFTLSEAFQPGGENGPRALAKAAALAFRTGNPAQAISLTLGIDARYPNNPSTPLAQLWLGKAQVAAGNVVSGQTTLQQVAQTKPDDYAGARASELAANLAPLSTSAGAATSTVSLLTINLDEGRVDAEQWLLSWITPTRALTDTLLFQDIRFVRGTALARIGFEPEALGEFGALLGDYGDDPVALYQLALHLRDLRLYRLSIAATDTLMRISPFVTPSALPRFIARLLYPPYYADLVQPAAEEFGVDPLLVLSVIRQESLFESFAESTAAAIGLMQVVGPTGAEISGELNWPPNYTAQDLTRPYVSVRFGTYYLSKQRRIFENDMYAALAAYNGGAGNSLIWQERSGGDPDVFYSVVSFEETQRYLRAVATNYAIYRRLYGR